MILDINKIDWIIQPWFFFDSDEKKEGVAIAIFYINLKTLNPKFNFSTQKTPNSKIEIYEE